MAGHKYGKSHSPARWRMRQAITGNFFILEKDGGTTYECGKWYLHDKPLIQTHAAAGFLAYSCVRPGFLSELGYCYPKHEVYFKVS